MRLALGIWFAALALPLEGKMLQYCIMILFCATGIISTFVVYDSCVRAFHEYKRLMSERETIFPIWDEIQAGDELRYREPTLDNGLGYRSSIGKAGTKNRVASAVGDCFHPRPSTVYNRAILRR